MLHRSAVIVVAFAFASLGALAPSAQQPTPKKRVALVIGNDAYKSLEPLKNPIRDAAALAELLRQHNFDVTLLKDLDRDAFEDALLVFHRDKVPGADTALVYYAGHGMEVSSAADSWDAVAPVDATVDCTSLQQRRMIRLEDVVNVTRGAPNQLVFIDACRSIAFKACRRGDGARGRGFRGIKPEPGQGERLLITFATGQRAYALDGDEGDHSPFAKVLLGQLKDNPRTHFYPLMFRVAGLVGQATAYRQMPQSVPEGGIPEACLAGDGCSNAIEDLQSQRERVSLLAEVVLVRSRWGLPRGAA